MKLWVPIAIAFAGFVGGRVARSAALSEQPPESRSAPYAPSVSAAPFVSLGYRELFADLMFVRLVGYFGTPDNEAYGMTALAEATTTLDPTFHRAYEFGAVAMTAASRGVDNAVRLRAVALLARGAQRYPTEYRLPKLAGEIYLADLVTEDPVQRRAWDIAGAELLDSASRKPHAPADMALSAAVLHTRFGQQQRAVENLKELLLTTDDTAAREKIIARLAKISADNSDEIAAELVTARAALTKAWLADRPAVTQTFYVLLGKPLPKRFDLGDLATGGHSVIDASTFERLAPPPDP